jgi:hypothetical protein
LLSPVRASESDNPIPNLRAALDRKFVQLLAAAGTTVCAGIFRDPQSGFQLDNKNFAASLAAQGPYLGVHSRPQNTRAAEIRYREIPETIRYIPDSASIPVGFSTVKKAMSRDHCPEVRHSICLFFWTLSSQQDTLATPATPSKMVCY